MTRVVWACSDCGSELPPPLDEQALMPCSACGGWAERVDPVLVATADLLEAVVDLTLHTP